MRIRRLFLILIVPLFAFKTANNLDHPDLSTPEKSFASIVDVLKSGETDRLEFMATPTGIKSLVTLAQQSDYENGMTTIGEDLDAAELTWDEITEDIYFLTARSEGKTHKMEFTNEEPGWMLYHLQLGGGVDSHQDTSSPAPSSPDTISDFSFDD